jgi:hypothetical protein
MHLNTYDKIGTTGYEMINRSIRRMDELVEGMDKDDPASVAKAQVEITKAKAQLAQGMFFVKSHQDLTDSLLLLFGIGKCCNCRC